VGVRSNTEVAGFLTEKYLRHRPLCGIFFWCDRCVVNFFFWCPKTWKPIISLSECLDTPSTKVYFIVSRSQTVSVTVSGVTYFMSGSHGLEPITRQNLPDLKQNRHLIVSRFEFLYQHYFGRLLFSGSRNYPIVNLNSRKDSWYQDYSVYNMMPLLLIVTILCHNLVVFPREGRLWNFRGTHKIHKHFLTESTWAGKEERDNVETVHTHLFWWTLIIWK